MRTFLFAATAALCTTLTGAQAATIDLSGTPGEGFSTITFSGTAQARRTSAIRTLSDDDYNVADSFEIENLILNPLLQNTIVTATGDLMLSTPNGSTTLLGIFLDDDAELATNGQFDDFGIRALSTFDYMLGDVLTFSGSATIPVDFASFTPGIDTILSFDIDLVARDQITFTTTDISAVPVPPAIAAMGLGLGALGVAARRRKRS